MISLISSPLCRTRSSRSCSGDPGSRLGEQEVDEAEHSEERVVDLVREPANELSECAQPARLEEGLSFGGS